MLEDIQTNGIFKSKYPDLSGSNWLQSIDPEDRKVFSRLGMMASDYGKKGGKARAKSANRDENGKFAPN